MSSLALIASLALAGGWFHNGSRSSAGANYATRVAGSTPAWENTASVNFDGANDYVTIGQPADLEWTPISKEMTISAWFKPDDVANQRFIVAKAFMSTADVSYVVAVNSDASLYFIAGDTTNGSGTILQTIWHHALYTTRDVGGTFTGFLYLDGVQVGTGAIVADQNLDMDWLFGAARWDSNSSDSYPYDGKIDEITFWDGAFSTVEVAEAYNGGVPANPAAHSRASDLLHYYPMGDGDTYPTLLDLVGVADGTMTNMAGAGNITTDVPALLDLLTCESSTLCDMNFVADDWNGSGDWTDRTATWTATKNGTPTKTASPFFASHSYVSGWSSANYFLLTANAAHAPQLTGDGSLITYEFLIESLPNDGLVSWYGNITNGNDGGWWFFTQSSSRFDIGVANLAAGNYLGGLTGVSLRTDNKPNLITLVYDAVTPQFRLYMNGSEHTGGSFPDTTVSGTFNNENCAIAIGGRWSCHSSALGGPVATMHIMQIVRHRSVLSGATIAARQTQYNTLKGY